MSMSEPQPPDAALIESHMNRADAEGVEGFWPPEDANDEEL
jgi:hypothetical protein